MPLNIRIFASRKSSLRYGENPHQQGALYTDGSSLGIANAQQLQGKELSFNNINDLDACWSLVREFAPETPAIVIIKHTNPCGAALGNTLAEAFSRALAADPISAFGGVIGANTTIDATCATEIARLFVEAIVAPHFTPEALTILSAKKNLRLLRIQPGTPTRVLKQISGGYLLQDEDLATFDQLTTVTQRQPTPAELSALKFAWIVAKHVKSNAIVYARTDNGFGQTIGIGAGQMSRVDAARFGAMKAALPLDGTVAASDAFFPFPDGIKTIAEAGATAIIQPGGSVRDAEAIAAADRLGLAMLFTGMRHFRHG